MSKTNINEYTNNELSLLILNDYYYYQLIDNKKLLLKEINKNFIYNKVQLRILLEDIEEVKEVR
tara:strand:+ start:289 stop:480 length:192 start_codon:yes stop_codon:yes gene_type:complete